MKVVKTCNLMVALLLLGCEGPPEPGVEIEVETQALRHRRPVEIRVGVLIDDGLPSKPSFTAAAILAEGQINRGLEEACSRYRARVIVRYFGGTTGQTQATRAIELVNVDGVHGVVSDVSGVPGGATGTVSVNRLNYEVPSRIAHPIPVTCYQCSSAFFNDPAQTDPGFADTANWMWRTFYKASFESAVQVRIVLNRPGLGDFNGDGRTKIVVYYDAGHLSAATTFPGLMDQIASSAHSVELIAKTLPSTAASRAAELAAVFDGHNDTTGADDGAPDSVYLAFLPQNFAESLGDYSSFPLTTPRPPATANNGARRDFLLGTLLANGGEGLDGNSVRVVADSRAGRAFLASYQAVSGGQRPELTASYLYDAVAAQVLAALTAGANGGLTPERIRDGLGQISNPRGRDVAAGSRGFERAAERIADHRPIDYGGAGSALDLRASDGEMFPELVHWRIQGGQFVELEAYRCDSPNPLCLTLP